MHWYSLYVGTYCSTYYQLSMYCAVQDGREELSFCNGSDGPFGTEKSTAAVTTAIVWNRSTIQQFFWVTDFLCKINLFCWFMPPPEIPKSTVIQKKG
jgi:hypothetical protein